MATHRDRVTGVDRVFVAASDKPLGIFSASLDANTGALMWGDKPEFVYEPERGSPKWFGMAECNGSLYATTNAGVYRREDGVAPHWELVLPSPTPVSRNRELRGLTAVPNPKSITGWPDKEMLIFSNDMAMWRASCPADPKKAHDVEAVQEIDLRAQLSKTYGREVAFVEAAFNRLNPLYVADDTPIWLVGFTWSYPVLDTPAGSGLDPVGQAFFAVRTLEGAYTLHRISDSADPHENILLLIRDAVPSPFVGEERVVYAAGFNEAYLKGSMGTAWVDRGVWSPSAKANDPGDAPVLFREALGTSRVMLEGDAE